MSEVPPRFYEIIDPAMLALARRLESLWKNRVHVAICVLPIDPNGEPAGLIFADTMAGTPLLIQTLANAYKIRVEELKNERNHSPKTSH